MDDKLKAKKEAKLEKMQNMLENYKKAFAEDGLIDTDEQAQIDELSALIKELREDMDETQTTDDTQELDGGAEDLLQRIEKSLSEMEKKFGIK
jgi:hypothetical protein